MKTEVLDLGNPKVILKIHRAFFRLLTPQTDISDM